MTTCYNCHRRLPDMSAYLANTRVLCLDCQPKPGIDFEECQERMKASAFVVGNIPASKAPAAHAARRKAQAEMAATAFNWIPNNRKATE